MWVLEIIVFLLLVATNAVTAFSLYRMSVVILNIEDAIEDSLDVLDDSYGKIGKILEMPIMVDSAEVRTVINEIKRSRDAILEVANIMGASIDESSVEDDEGEK